MNKRITLIIILCIISCGIGVYGANVYPYQASDVSYNASNGDSMTVNDALNELYSSSKIECEIWCTKILKMVEVGDYVKMTPTNTSYTISKDLTGYTEDQTINPSELNLWRIIKINEDRTIEMVSENVSSVNIYFKGQTGYLNLVGTLNLIASQYGNSKYTIDSRIIGYNGQTEYLTDTSKFTYPAPWKSSTSDNSKETLGGGDVMYEEDTNLVEDILGTLAATNPSGTKKGYWLGSRYYYYKSSASYKWRGRIVDTDGSITSNNSSLRNYDSGWMAQADSYTIRPIVKLKSGLTVTGSGTRVDPWVLE